VFWTASGEELTVPITRAMSVQVISDEEERGGRIEPWRIIPPDGRATVSTDNVVISYSFNHSGRYRKQTIDATLTVKNLRSEAVKIAVTRSILGGNFVSDTAPKVKIVADYNSMQGKYNRTQELKWNLTLEPGETRKIDYTYERYVPF
jgi:hypothetical protein